MKSKNGGESIHTLVPPPTYPLFYVLMAIANVVSRLWLDSVVLKKNMGGFQQNMVWEHMFYSIFSRVVVTLVDSKTLKQKGNAVLF